MEELPRSVRLAAWGTAVLQGAARVVDAVDAVTRDDEPHSVLVADPQTGAAAGLADLLGVLLSCSVPMLRVVLPAPGDVLGLPGPPAVNAAALEAGECVLAEPHPEAEPAGSALSLPHGPWAVVPEVTRFGSHLEPGAMVAWTLHRCLPRRVTDVGSVGEAERHLREALLEATTLLTRLDVARWREDAAASIAVIRDGALPRNTVPPFTPPRCVAVLTTAARVQAIVDLATLDDGGAITSYEATQRREALRDLAAVSRRAMVAAVNGILETRG